MAVKSSNKKTANCRVQVDCACRSDLTQGAVVQEQWIHGITVKLNSTFFLMLSVNTHTSDTFRYEIPRYGYMSEHISIILLQKVFVQICI